MTTVYSRCIKAKAFTLLCLISTIFHTQAETQSVDAQAFVSQLNIDLRQSSVSGLSSGGYMATQLQLSHSELIQGAGIVGAGPYYCALGDISIALGQCVNKTSDSINKQALLAEHVAYQEAGLVSPSSELANDRVMIIHGSLDTTVNRQAANLLHDQYGQWLVPSALRYVSERPFAHHMPTVSEGVSCDVSATPFLGNCNYDAAGEILKFIYPELEAPAEKTAELARLDLSSLVDLSGSSIADHAYMYVPNSCKDGQKCRLHISFHGCKQSEEFVGDAYAKNAGFNRWAQSNNMLVLYPQIKKSMFMPLNPQGCWDWWGYTNENYANRQGTQIKAMHALMLALGNVPL